MNAHDERPDALGYCDNCLDRRAGQRDDAAALARWRADPQARSFVLLGDIPVLRRVGNGYDALFDLASASAMGNVGETVFLGLDGERPLFGTLIQTQEPETDQGREDILVQDLRSIAVQGLLPAQVLGPLGQAKSLLHWHQRHRFCANCGQPTQSTAAGWRRECAGCGTQHFPRIDPVVIMMAVHEGRCVLGRQSRFPAGMYSCLAGFVEPGETFEDAVRRELFEEAGLTTGAVSYLASQPWPFPSSIMIGCIGQALGRDLVVDREELEDARWFDRAEVVAMLAGTHPDGLTCPPPIAIAHALMKAWAEGEAG